LNKRETRGLLWVLGEAQEGIISVDYEGEQVEIEIMQSNCRIVPEIKEGNIRIKVEIKVQGSLGANPTPVDFSATDRLRKLNTKLASAVKGEVEAALKRARTLRADPFAFGEAVHRKYPKEWRELQEKWTDVFLQIQVEIQVRSNLRLLGLITRPVIMKED
jgi:spore germination protein KC